MFAFLSQPKAYADPLQSRKAASAWLAQLSDFDALERQKHVVDAFDAMRRSLTEVDRHRLLAIAHIDAAFESEHRRMVQLYLENRHSSPRLAARFRQTAVEVNQAFLNAYQRALDPVCKNAATARWKPLVPLLLARLARCLGIDAKLRLLNHEHWIPARWAELHKVFSRARKLEVHRVPVTLDAKDDPFAPKCTVEQEYIYTLLIHRLDTGNLVPAEFEWVATKLRSWSDALQLETAPRSPGGFYVDLASSRGLVRRIGNDRGAKIVYLDTTAIITQFDAAAAALRDSLERDTADATAQAQIHRHRATLDKVRPVLSPVRDIDLRRHPRRPIDIPAVVRIGLPDIGAQLSETREKRAATRQIAASPPTGDWQSALRYDARDAVGVPPYFHPHEWSDGGTLLVQGDGDHGLPPPHLPGDNEQSIEHIEMGPVADTATASPNVTEAAGASSADDSEETQPAWRLKDHSVTGWRVSAPAELNDSLALHTLVALRPSDADEWMLAVVRRVHRYGNKRVDAGVALMADRVIAVTLHARRGRKDRPGVLVDGVDATAAVGPRFVGLYLLPSSRQETRVAIRSLVIPTPEYAEGRRLTLATSRSDYTIVLRHLLDQNAEWSWVTVQIADRTPRTA